MSEQDGLFDLPAPPPDYGPVRAGLESDLEVGITTSSAGVASLRALADQLDALARSLSSRFVPARDRLTLASLQRQFDATYARVFASIAHEEQDPLALALADFRATEAALSEFAAGVDGGSANGNPEVRAPY